MAFLKLTARVVTVLLLAAAFVPTNLSAAARSAPLLLPSGSDTHPPPQTLPGALRARPVKVSTVAVTAAIEQREPLELTLFDGLTFVAEVERVENNPSGSISWIGRIRDQTHGSIVLVSREGVTIGSIRVASSVFMLLYAGRDSSGQPLNALYEMDENDPAMAEEPPTEVELSAEQLAAGRRRAELLASGQIAEDDGSIEDLMVVYTPKALELAGSVVAMENMIDLGVTETNMSYEASGIAHRLRLVHTALTDFNETLGLGDPRDLLQDPDDGFMDEIHPLRDLYGADLVKLIVSTGGCGRAFIMDQVSLAFEAFAFCWTGFVCISPGYSFEHELGHVQGGRHHWGADDVDNAPFTFNHGYYDATAGFRTIMAPNDSANCPGCPRLLAWSNPDRNEPSSGAPLGIPEGDTFAADNRKTLNATAWTVANFRPSTSVLFGDGFETGDTTTWSISQTGGP